MMQLTQHVLLLKKVLYLVEIALLRASVTLKTKDWDDSYRYGYNIIQKGLRAPIEKILENAGFEPSESINNILQNKNLNWGYNSRTYNDDGTKGYCDMLVRVLLILLKLHVWPFKMQYQLLILLSPQRQQFLMNQKKNVNVPPVLVQAWEWVVESNGILKHHIS